jgi:deoxyribodipyrimidine photo-lyase
MTTTSVRTIVLLLRHDLRVGDHPLFHELATAEHGFTHLLCVYVLPAHQIEISGFINDGSKSPYPEARSKLGKYWRCGPHRARFIAQAVWAMKGELQKLGSDLVMRAGRFEDVSRCLISGLNDNGQRVAAVWMTSEEGIEEGEDQDEVARVCSENNVDFQLKPNENYYIAE